MGDPNSSERKDGKGTSQRGTDRLKSLQSQVDGVKDIMVENIDRILARGERLDNLMGKSEDLEAGAQRFQHVSKKVACASWWKNKKLMVIIVIALVVILIIILLATGVIPVSGTTPKPTTTPP